MLIWWNPDKIRENLFGQKPGNLSLSVGFMPVVHWKCAWPRISKRDFHSSETLVLDIYNYGEIPDSDASSHSSTILQVTSKIQLDLFTSPIYNGCEIQTHYQKSKKEEMHQNTNVTPGKAGWLPGVTGNTKNVPKYILHCVHLKLDVDDELDEGRKDNEQFLGFKVVGKVSENVDANGLLEWI